jgi:hypothetical protein
MSAALPVLESPTFEVILNTISSRRVHHENYGRGTGRRMPKVAPRARLPGSQKKRRGCSFSIRRMSGGQRMGTSSRTPCIIAPGHKGVTSGDYTQNPCGRINE